MAFDEEEVDFDFDAAWADRIVTRPKIRLKGETYLLPAVIPAKLVLYITKATRGKKATDEVDPVMFVEMMSLIFGEENKEKILESGVGIDQLPEVIEQVQKIYMDKAAKNIAKSKANSVPGKNVSGN
jgi:hypothetical protein